MLTIVACVAGLILLLLLVEFLGRQKIVGAELKRKSFHLIAGSFVAFWPWLMSWRAIEILGLGMLAGVVANDFIGLFNFTKGLNRRTYGDAFLAVAIVLAAYFANDKIFFVAAILNVSLADASAALIGQRYGARWRYKIFDQTKTIVGTMTFWLVSFLVVAISLLWAHRQMSFAEYIEIIIILPPILAALENLSYLGIDNLSVPLATIALLKLLG